jgi:hypothetical protein
MTDQPHIYGAADADDKAKPGEQGMRGERLADQAVDDPALRHRVKTANGERLVQETSGTAFAEATGRAGNESDERQG